MNEIITKLNEIEEKADAIISDARARKDRMMAQLSEEVKSIDAKYDRLAEEAVEELRKRLTEEADLQTSRQRERNDAAMKEADLAFSERKEAMAEEVFRWLIGNTAAEETERKE